MGGVHLVVAIGADEIEVGIVARTDEHMVEKIEGGAVAPLQVVDEQDQGVLRRSQAGEEVAEQVVESLTRLHGRQRHDFRLGTQEDFQFRDHVRKQSPPVSRRSQDGRPPGRHPFVAFGEKGANQVTQGLQQ